MKALNESNELTMLRNYSSKQIKKL